MKLADLFISSAEQETARRHVERLYRANVAAGWHPDDARRCAERDGRWGLYRYAFSAEEIPAERVRPPPKDSGMRPG